MDVGIAAGVTAQPARLTREASGLARRIWSVFVDLKREVVAIPLLLPNM